MASNTELSISNNPCLECSLHLARLGLQVLNYPFPCRDQKDFIKCHRCKKVSNMFTCTNMDHPALFSIGVALHSAVSTLADEKTSRNLMKVCEKQILFLRA
ncbi:hypothetical protein FSPOR_3 [Fusarium sporotrichioides]|uniref:Uncharacterized protein n=1 Tax=Fusarium sporotrichioides TaxID=5514 RepID=A0A395SW95_FUSSP|nr:hypothetical protein FSPOR_3 [Fusarium sporotrichioides]